ncbi:MAG: hypothetical protein V4582_16485 [Pseudomonadota bacterium]
MKDIPKIPSTAYQTLAAEWHQWRLSRNLTGIWTSQAQSIKSGPAEPSVRIELSMEGGTAVGMITSRAVPKWGFPDPTVQIMGTIEGPILKLTAFDFIDGKKVDFARFNVRIEPEIPEGISEGPVEIDFSRLTITTEWQKTMALPKEFVLVSAK